MTPTANDLNVVWDAMRRLEDTGYIASSSRTAQETGLKIDTVRKFIVPALLLCGRIFRYDHGPRKLFSTYSNGDRPPLSFQRSKVEIGSKIGVPFVDDGEY